jgi:2-methylcitrate dehydratase
LPQKFRLCGNNEEVLMDSHIYALARYASALRYEDLFPDVIHECKRRLIDTLGCLAGAYHAQPAVIARALARRVKSDNPARIIGSLEPSTPEMAAFANGVALRYLDYNDAYFALSSGHPSDTIAAVLAQADAQHAAGRDVITAITLAYEAFCNCSESLPRESGWDYAVYSVLASAVGVGHLLGLSEAAMRQAISLAIVPNMALEETRRGELSMWKGCAAANAARNGVFAAQLAAEGLTGPDYAIEGRWGMQFAVGKFDWQPFGGTSGPRVPYKVTQTHLKCYPAVVHAQTPIAAALQLHKEMSGAQIQSVAIESYWVANRYTDRASPLWRPATRETADHSLPYIVAAALLDGDISEHSFSLERIADPQLQALLAHTTLTERPEYTARHPGAWPCRITVTLTSGAIRTAEVQYFRGHAKNPLSDADIEQKFRSLAAPVMDAARIEAVFNKCWQLERLADIGELLQELRFRN